MPAPYTCFFSTYPRESHIDSSRQLADQANVLTASAIFMDEPKHAFRYLGTYNSLASAEIIVIEKKYKSEGKEQLQEAIRDIALTRAYRHDFVGLRGASICLMSPLQPESTYPPVDIKQAESASIHPDINVDSVVVDMRHIETKTPPEEYARTILSLRYFAATMQRGPIPMFGRTGQHAFPHHFLRAQGQAFSDLFIPSSFIWAGEACTVEDFDSFLQGLIG